MDDPDRIGRHWEALRRVVIFALGVAVIVDALWDQKFVAIELVIGMILVGILPLEDFMRIVLRRNGAARYDRHQEDRP